MQTSCGSRCYTVPELVISEAIYVGSAVDVWSCGAILYSMLAGYLPFDDDPAKSDGGNINPLYKCIVTTPLTFPDYVSQEAWDLRGLMLVPDPKLRADLNAIMAHHWLQLYAHLLEHDVQDLDSWSGLACDGVALALDETPRVPASDEAAGPGCSCGATEDPEEPEHVHGNLVVEWQPAYAPFWAPASTLGTKRLYV